MCMMFLVDCGSFVLLCCLDEIVSSSCNVFVAKVISHDQDWISWDCSAAPKIELGTARTINRKLASDDVELHEQAMKHMVIPRIPMSLALICC